MLKERRVRQLQPDSARPAPASARWWPSQQPALHAESRPAGIGNPSYHNFQSSNPVHQPSNPPGGYAAPVCTDRRSHTRSRAALYLGPSKSASPRVCAHSRRTCAGVRNEAHLRQGASRRPDSRSAAGGRDAPHRRRNAGAAAQVGARARAAASAPVDARAAAQGAAGEHVDPPVPCGQHGTILVHGVVGLALLQARIANVTCSVAQQVHARVLGFMCRPMLCRGEDREPASPRGRRGYRGTRGAPAGSSQPPAQSPPSPGPPP